MLNIILISLIVLVCVFYFIRNKKKSKKDYTIQLILLKDKKFKKVILETIEEANEFNLETIDQRKRRAIDSLFPFVVMIMEEQEINYKQALDYGTFFIEGYWKNERD